MKSCIREANKEVLQKIEFARRLFDRETIYELFLGIVIASMFIAMSVGLVYCDAHDLLSETMATNLLFVGFSVLSFVCWYSHMVMKNCMKKDKS